MKRIRMFGLTLGMVLGFVAAAAFAAEPSQAKLMKQAKITKAEAERIALAKVSRGIVKSAEIENEKGHLVWSFDIARPGTQDITEILVDANTGKIISTQTETPRDQAKEAAADETLKTENGDGRLGAVAHKSIIGDIVSRGDWTIALCLRYAARVSGSRARRG